jgi:OOP family OmpA-OmpF porin
MLLTLVRYAKGSQDRGRACFSSKILPPNWLVVSSKVANVPDGRTCTGPRLPRHTLLVPGLADRRRREEEPMKRVEVAILAGAMLLGGCATKRYVADQVDPVNAKVGEVDQKQQSTQKQLDEAENKISAADEKATSADARAGDAIGRADAASKKSDQVKEELRGELNDRIANLDDYKSAGDATVLFKFNSAELTSEGKQQLNQLVTSEVGNLKRYFIAIQGFTDKIGSAEYNLNLSRRRAEAVQTYLVAQHNVPVFRIQIVGLGKDKPINDQKTRDDREKNRRVEVTVFNADANQAASKNSASR